MRRLVIIFSFLLTAYSFLAWRWVGALDLKVPERLLTLFFLALPFASIVWLFARLFERDEANFEDTFSVRLIQWSVFSSMGMLSFLFTFTLIRDLTSLSLRLLGRATLNTPASFWVILIASLLCFFIGSLSARFAIEITRTDIPIKNLPVEFEGFSIAQISDLHIGTNLSAAFIQRVIHKTNQLNADIIVLTGDIIDGYFDTLKLKIELLKNLHAKGSVTSGRYIIMGNHEYYWNYPSVVEGVKQLGITFLNNQADVIRRGSAALVVAGVPDYMATQLGEPKPDPLQALEGTPPDAVRILLAHQPSFVHDAAAAGYDLQLSGHTHGGQFFPWTLLVRFFHPFHRGLGRLGKTWVYVNRGTGSWGPPMRLGSAPEISFLRLINASGRPTVENA
jgi:predicted MPP superfamily phosphohydrolase